MLTPSQFLQETSQNSDDDHLLITAKARFTIDLLQVAYKALVLKQGDVRASYASQEPHDTPAFDRKQNEILQVQVD